MENFSEITIAIAGLSAILANIWHQYNNRKVNDNQEIIETLIARIDALDKINDGQDKEILELKKEKHQYKNQYHDLLIKSKEIEAELKVYKQTQGHKHDTKLD